MILKAGTDNRCVVLLFYDPQGVVDDYVLSMLDDVGKCARFVLVVVNGPVKPEGRKRLAAHANEVLYRVNVGFDVGGYRDAIFHLGFRMLGTFDEVVLMNYTFFAPIHPFREMFEAMAGRDLDFWGITKHHFVPKDPYEGKISYGCLPEHINSHFFAIRRRMITSWYYHDFMCNMPPIQSYVDSITQYEAIFTRHFEDLGFTWGLYADTARFEGTFTAPFMYAADALLKEDRCPIIKRRAFFDEYLLSLDTTVGESSMESAEYIKANSAFPMRMIWENVLRLNNLADIRVINHLRHIADSTVSRHTLKKGEAALFVLGEQAVFEALASNMTGALPEELDLYFLPDDTAGVSAPEASGEPAVSAQENPGGPALKDSAYGSRLLAAARKAADYPYVCVLHVKPFEQTEGPYSNAVSHLYLQMMSLLENGAEIGNILDLFAENESLGLLVPPVPHFGTYGPAVGDGFMGRFEDVKKACGACGFSFALFQGNAHPAFPLGGSFWCRGDLLSAMLAKAGDFLGDEQLLTLMLPYLAQSEGRLTAIVSGSTYASIEATNEDWRMRVNNAAVFERFGPDFFKLELSKIDGRKV